jgi:NADPH:quinone reductase-like Zn-dependent oxidoreductase
METRQSVGQEAAPTMKALLAHSRGGPDVLVYERAPIPRPGPNEISVAVRVAAITFAELTWPETWESHGVDRTPIIPSHEFAGVVAEIGVGVVGFVPGDLVFGLVPFNRNGAAAEFVVVPVTSVTHKPESVSDADAAASVLPALTAWEALRDQAHLSAGQRVLITGGTGAVGSFMTQFAHGMGADVTVTVTSALSESRAKLLGADHVVVTPRDSEPEGLEGFDVAIDAAGSDIPEWLYAAVRPAGQLIVLQMPPSQALADKYDIVATFFVVTTQRERLDELAEQLAAGGVEVAIAATFPLSEGKAAYQSGSLPARSPGKTIIRVS